MPDREGVDLADDADPVSCGRFLAHKLVQDDALPADLAGCFVDVTDASGERVAFISVVDEQTSA